MSLFNTTLLSGIAGRICGLSLSKRLFRQAEKAVSLRMGSEEPMLRLNRKWFALFREESASILKQSQDA